MEYRTAVKNEFVGPWKFRFASLQNFEAAIDELYAELNRSERLIEMDDLCPYFGFMWPGARALARWIYEQAGESFTGKSVLEIGCGLALPSFVCARLGARVTASDRHPDVLQFLNRNLALNPEVQLSYLPLDWRHETPALEGMSFDWILASDILYDRDQPASLVTFLENRLARDGQAVILDPDRSYWERLVTLSQGKGLSTRITKLAPLNTREPHSSVLIHITNS